MQGDRYLKIVLTIIAIQLFWIGIRDFATPVTAQQAVTPVVIRGVEMGDTDRGLPVIVAGARAPLPVETRGTVMIEAGQPITIRADRPIKIEVDQPLKVESVPYVPSPRPGE
jgi:hypothetical protein